MFLYSKETFKLSGALLFNAQQQPWRGMTCNMSEINPISSMICSDESQFMHWLARYYYSGCGKIVDMGPLAGGSTYSLASGLSRNEKVPKARQIICSYDLWDFRVGWEQFFPGRELEPGGNIQPLFEENLKEYIQYVKPYKGDICSQVWPGEPIEILFLDAAKAPETMSHICRYFFPHLIPGISLVLHQDFISCQCPWIHLTMAHLSEFFEYVDSPFGGTVCFLLKESIPASCLGIDCFSNVSLEDGRAMFRKVQDRLRGVYKLCVCLAEAFFVGMRNEVELVHAIVHTVLDDPDFSRFPRHVQPDVDIILSRFRLTDK